MIRTAYPLFRRGGLRVEVAKAPSAGATARPDESGLDRSEPEHESFACKRTAQIDFVCNVAFAIAVMAVAVAFAWPGSNPHPSAPVITGTLALAAVIPAGPAGPQGEPVRIKNAFDATEVFEFPHGTTESDAREAVGQLLLRRARDRRAEGLPFRRMHNLQLDRGQAAQQPQVFVTKLLARAKEP